MTSGASERRGTSAQHVIVWEFSVRPGEEPVFEGAYGPDGEWARLFALSPEFRGTELLRSSTTPRRYLTVDRWASGESFQRFHEAHHAEYAALDAKCERLTEAEVARDAWTAVDLTRSVR
ncbi:MAG: antibiotic biosynthesis monooxygenase family protein [Myxococcaceae bacterium]